LPYRRSRGPCLAGPADLVGPIAIVGACVAWGLDNNLTRKVSLADPLQIVELKGLIAGPVNLALGLLAGGSIPGLPALSLAGVVGFLGYGVSLALFVMALRDLGTARTGAYFSTAPFIGAVAALAILREPMTLRLLAAGALMALGVWLHLTEDHDHEHLHEPMEHSHPHVHDAHHQHVHGLTTHAANRIRIGTATNSSCTSIRTSLTCTIPTATARCATSGNPRPPPASRLAALHFLSSGSV
jgi:hypothetical protein